MSTVRYIAIDPERLDRMRDRGADEYGNPWTLRVANGGEPLRCCLRRAEPDERIALICYTPWTQPSPWMEAGPVFVHFERCAGYETPHLYPAAFLDHDSVMNTFDHTGARAYQHITFVRPAEDHEAVIRALMAEAEVAYLHVRSAEALCFTFEVQPAA
ncbi:MAG: DUF1203 domain-containing protein [Kutzneria sp.]|nr:DUF1203 domain-containing protein [Kutzneria sp.]MBV9847959.1 DUF1203 domain-containing protein [Kutzneria sp.]